MLWCAGCDTRPPDSSEYAEITDYPKEDAYLLQSAEINGINEETLADEGLAAAAKAGAPAALRAEGLTRPSRASGSNGGDAKGDPEPVTSLRKDNMGWVNFVVASVWPHFRAAGNRKGRQVVLEALTEALSQNSEATGVSADVTLDVELDLGSTPPTFSGCHAYHRGRGDSEGIEIGAFLDFQPRESYKFSAHVRGKVAGLPVNVVAGLKFFEVSGLACIMLCPLFEDMPIFGGVQAFFMDTPRVRMQFSGIADMPKILRPLVMGAVRRAVVKNIQDLLVLPKCQFIPIRSLPIETHMALSSPIPEGCLSVTVHAARGLIGSDWHLFGKSTCDPYVDMQCGAHKSRTRTIWKTLAPAWDPPEVVNFLLHSPNQMVYVQVYDDDIGSTDDLIGQADAISAAELWSVAKEGKVWFPLALASSPSAGAQPTPAGAVCLSAQYFEIVDIPASPSTRRKTVIKGDDAHSNMRVCTMKIIGMNCGNQHVDVVMHSIATVTMYLQNPTDLEEDEDGEQHQASEGLASSSPRRRRAAASTKSSFNKTLNRKLSASSKYLTSFSTHRGKSKPVTWKTMKAKAWGAKESDTGPKGAGLKNVSRQMQDLVERLHRDKGMSFAEIAEIAGMEESLVKLSVGLHRELDVVWLQAFHVLLKHAAATIEVEVNTLKNESLGKVVVDLDEVERAEGCQLRCQTRLAGIKAAPDVVLEYEVELRGLKPADLDLPDGQKEFADGTISGRSVRILS